MNSDFYEIHKTMDKVDNGQADVGPYSKDAELNVQPDNKHMDSSDNDSNLEYEYQESTVEIDNTGSNVDHNNSKSIIELDDLDSETFSNAGREYAESVVEIDDRDGNSVEFRDASSNIEPNSQVTDANVVPQDDELDVESEFNDLDNNSDDNSDDESDVESEFNDLDNNSDDNSDDDSSEDGFPRFPFDDEIDAWFFLEDIFSNDASFQKIKTPEDIEHNCLSGNVILPQNVEDELKSEKCSICHDTFGEPQNDSTHLFVHRTPSANHTFHLVCFLRTRKTKCPLCNQEIIKSDEQRSNSSPRPTLSLNVGLVIKLLDFNLIKLCDQVFGLSSKTFQITLDYFFTHEIESLSFDNQCKFIQLIRYLVEKPDFEQQTKGNLLREIVHKCSRVETTSKEAIYAAISSDLNLVSQIVALTPYRIDFYMASENESQTNEMRSYYYYLTQRNIFRRNMLTQTSRRILESLAVFLITIGNKSFSNKIIDTYLDDKFRTTPNYLYSLIQAPDGLYNADVLKIVQTQRLVEKILAAADTSNDYTCLLNAVFAAKTHNLSLVLAFRSCIRILDNDVVDKISKSFALNQSMTVSENSFHEEWEVFRTIFDALEKNTFRTKLISQAELYFDYGPFYEFLSTKWAESKIDRNQLIQDCMNEYDMIQKKINFMKRVVDEIIDANDIRTLGEIHFHAVRCGAKTIVQAVNSRIDDDNVWVLERSLLLTMQKHKFDLFKSIARRIPDDSHIFGECLLEECFSKLPTRFQQEILNRQTVLTEELSCMRLRYLEKICRTHPFKRQRLAEKNAQLIQHLTFKHQQLLYQHSVSYSVTPFLNELENLSPNFFI